MQQTPTMLGALGKIEEHALRAMAQMRLGVPLWQTDVPHKWLVRNDICRLLGVTSDHFPLANCRDGRIIRTAMAAVYPEEGQVVDLGNVAHTLGEDDEFVRRVAHIHSPGIAVQAQWLGKSSPIGAAHAYAGINGGTVCAEAVVPLLFKTWDSFRSVLYSMDFKKEWTTTADTAILKPCPFCDGRRRGPMRIPEPSGLVCLDCRKDALGITWPAEPYNRYLAESATYFDLGLVDEMPPDPNSDATIHWRGVELPRNRKVDDIPAEIRIAVLEAYGSDECTVTDIPSLHPVTRGELYAIVDKAELIRRSKRRDLSNPSACQHP